MSALIQPWGPDLNEKTLEEVCRMLFRWLDSAFWAIAEPLIGSAAVIGALILLVRHQYTAYGIPVAIILALTGLHQLIALGSRHRRWRSIASFVSLAVYAFLFTVLLWAYPGVIVLFALAVLSMANAVHLRTPNGPE